MGQLYDKALEALLSQSPSIDLDSNTIKAALVNTTTDYVFSSSHQYLSSVLRYAGTTDQTLSSKTVTNGVFDAADLVFPTVIISGTKTIGGVVIYQDTGNPSTSPLIAFVDGFTPVTPAASPGSDVNVTWSNGTNKIFKIG